MKVFLFKLHPSINSSKIKYKKSEFSKKNNMPKTETIKYTLFM